jgi:hypothetical protein
MLIQPKQQPMARKLNQTVYLPVSVADWVEKKAEELGISKNEMLNTLIIMGMEECSNNKTTTTTTEEKWRT